MATYDPLVARSLEHARLDAIEDLELIEGDDAELDRFVRLTGSILDVPTAAITLLGANRQYFGGAMGFAPRVQEMGRTPISHSICRLAIEEGETFVVHDAARDVRTSDHRGVRDMAIAAYAGVPLTLDDGVSLGALCAIDTEPRMWTDRQIGALEDIAAAARNHLEMRRELLGKQMFDRRTGLPNRHNLRTHAAALLEAADDPASVAAICFGVCDFGLLNEAMGEEFAEARIQQVAMTLADAAADSGADGVLGRLARDVFAWVGGGIAARTDALRIADRMSQAVRDASTRGEDRAIPMSVDAGVAFAEGSADGRRLISRASDAMEHAKRSHHIEVATAESTQQARDRFALRTALPRAIGNGEISFVYQPILEIDGRSISGFEVLARWLHPELGWVRPDVFIALAEETGDIIALDEYGLATACGQVAEWRLATGRDFYASINISPLQLEAPGFDRFVLGAAADAGLPLDRLQLELTERVLISADPRHRRTLERLSECGVRIALDDFGTGYSALGYLNRFPVDVLKIDRSFMLESAEEEKAPIVKAIVALAESSDLDLVAEGIETEAHAATMLELGVNCGQGYLFAKPMTVAAIEPELG